VTRNQIARRVGIDSFLLLGIGMLIGSHVLGFFGLSIPDVKIAGGMLVIANGWRMVNAEESTDARDVAAAVWGDEEIARRAFYPLTFPLTVGPGSLSVAVTLGAGAHREGLSLLGGLIGAIVGITVVSIIVYLTYRYAYDVVGRLGSTGTVILLRLSAFILLAIGVEILCAGLTERFAIFHLAAG
jgi:multiple antibiotic resistance protein